MHPVAGRSVLRLKMSSLQQTQTESRAAIDEASCLFQIAALASGFQMQYMAAKIMLGRLLAWGNAVLLGKCGIVFIRVSPRLLRI